MICAGSAESIRGKFTTSRCDQLLIVAPRELATRTCLALRACPLAEQLRLGGVELLIADDPVFEQAYQLSKVVGDQRAFLDFDRERHVFGHLEVRVAGAARFGVEIESSVVDIGLGQRNLPGRRQGGRQRRGLGCQRGDIGNRRVSGAEAGETHQKTATSQKAGKAKARVLIDKPPELPFLAHCV